MLSTLVLGVTTAANLLFSIKAYLSRLAMEDHMLEIESRVSREGLSLERLIESIFTKLPEDGPKIDKPEHVQEQQDQTLLEEPAQWAEEAVSDDVTEDIRMIKIAVAAGFVVHVFAVLMNYL